MTNHTQGTQDLEPVSASINFVEMEERVLAYWKEIDAFQTSLKKSEGRKPFSFYDGPPFATGLPHYGHILAGTIKDIVTRYAHQTGHHVERRAGWDCHGLPIEFEIEKMLGIKTKDDVLAFGIDKYNEACRSIVMKYASEWDTVVTRLGRWIDFQNDYKTMDLSFMESVWWVFGQLFEKGLIYRGYKVMPYSVGCTTPLSNFEAGDNYKEVYDPAITVSFPLLEGDNGEALDPTDPQTPHMVAWTTTPWTLPSNLCLCLNPTLDYVKVRDTKTGKVYIVAEARLVEIFKPKKGAKKDDPKGYEVLAKYKGVDLKGRRYKPLFEYFVKSDPQLAERSFRVVVDDYVTSDSGTGVVHCAPGFGEDDYRVCLENGIIIKGDSVPCPVDANGRFVDPITDYKGVFVKDADEAIMNKLREDGRLVAKGSIKHQYPFCFSPDTRVLMYDGSVRSIIDVKVGDKLCGDDGTPRTVTDLIPRQSGQMYAVRQTKGATYYVNGKHILVCKASTSMHLVADKRGVRRKVQYYQRCETETCKSNCGGIRRRELSFPTAEEAEAAMADPLSFLPGFVPNGTVIELSVEQWRNLCMPSLRPNLRGFRVPFPFITESGELPVEAYFLGAWLGDGDSDDVTITGNYEDRDVANYLGEYAARLGMICTESIYHRSDSITAKWRIVHRTVGGRPNALKEKLHELGVLNNKHIPQSYMNASEEDRFMLLAGLLDTDGCLSVRKEDQHGHKSSASYQFFQTDRRKALVEQVKHLALSLGIQVSIVRHNKMDSQDLGYETFSDGHRFHSGWKIELTGERIKLIPCRFQRKQMAIMAPDATFKDSFTSTITVEETDEREEFCGVTVDGNRRFLLEDCTVVHNCWRSDSPLIYRAIPSWFVAVEKIKDRLLVNNEKTNWVPDFVKTRRFHNWLEDARDWAISRTRYWGTPIPLWVSDDWEEIVCVSSIEELSKLTGKPIEEITDIHRHHIDQLTIPSKRPGHAPLRRIEEVFDCWLESGSMPYAQGHYPFENVEKFENSFPADFIAEGLDQCRGWYYTLLVLGTALFDKSPFTNVIVNGLVLAEDGKKMSKRLQNYPDPMHVINAYGADALRLYLINSPVVRAEPLRFKEDGVKDVVRDLFIRWFNAYRFFVQQAISFKKEHGHLFTSREAFEMRSDNVMDQWISSLVQSLIKFVRAEMQAYRLYTVIPKLLHDIDQLTNWYVRMNRKRLKGDGSKNDWYQALCTLYDVLMNVTRTMAPFTPFLTESMYQNLKRLVPEGEREDSVHYLMVPEYDESRVNLKIERSVARMQQVVEVGRTLRDRKGVGLRTPLREVIVCHTDEEYLQDLRDLEGYICEELNTKELKATSEIRNFINLSASPNNKALGARFKKQLREVANVITKLDHDQCAEYVKTGSVTILGEHQLSGDDIIINKTFTGDSSKYESQNTDEKALVILNHVVDDELRQEGMCRLMTSTVQQLRKKAGLVPDDKITVYFELQQDENGQLVRTVVQKYENLLSQAMKNMSLQLETAPAESKVIIRSKEDVTGSGTPVDVVLTW